MLTGQHKLSPEQIQDLLKKRLEGWSLPKLGEYFERDHTVILYHCQKANLPHFRAKYSRSYPIKVEHLKTIILKTKRPYKQYKKFPEPIKGKDYLDYLNDSIKDKFQLEKAVENYNQEKFKSQPRVYSFNLPH